MKVLICYYSTYGNVYKMANLVADGVSQVAGAEPVVRTVPELIPAAVIESRADMKAGRGLQKDIPLVTAECFGLASLGQLLTAIILADSLGQWFGPWSAGRIFEATGSYNAAWASVTAAGIVGAVAISAVNPARSRRSEEGVQS